jgi:hypothetical protein
MARPTHDEIIRTLTKEVAVLGADLQSIRADVTRIETTQGKAADSANDMQRRLVVVEERLGELKRSLEESARRRWAVLPTVVGALVGAVAALLSQLLLALWRR